MVDDDLDRQRQRRSVNETWLARVSGADVARGRSRRSSGRHRGAAAARGDHPVAGSGTGRLVVRWCVAHAGSCVEGLGGLGLRTERGRQRLQRHLARQSPVFSGARDQGLRLRNHCRRARRRHDRLEQSRLRRLRSDGPVVAAAPDHRVAALLNRHIRHPGCRSHLSDRPGRVLPDCRQFGAGRTRRRTLPHSGRAYDGRRPMDRAATRCTAGLSSGDLHGPADRTRHCLDRCHRRRDGRSEIRLGLRPLGCLLRWPKGCRARRHGFDRRPRPRKRPYHHFDRRLGFDLAPPAILSGLRSRMGTIAFSNVSKVYHGPKDVRALDDVSLTVGEGEFVALLGPSGCGKSTLLNLLAGFETVSEGTLLFDGEPVARPGPDSGVVFQEAALFPWLSVWENVIFGPRVQGLGRADYEERARRLIKQVGLTSFSDSLPVQLSGGMRQRVGLAREMTMNTRALLMDEPFGALDAQTRLSMQQLLLDVWQSLGTTVLFVTHDIDEAILLSDRICVMSARPGRIVRTIPVDLPRPRSIASLTSSRFTAYKAEIMADIKVAEHH